MKFDGVIIATEQYLNQLILVLTIHRKLLIVRIYACSMELYASVKIFIVRLHQVLVVMYDIR